MMEILTRLELSDLMPDENNDEMIIEERRVDSSHSNRPKEKQITSNFKAMFWLKAKVVLKI